MEINNQTIKMNPYSYSKIASYNGCPRKFKYQYIDKIKVEQKDTKALDRGSIIHLIFETHKDVKRLSNSKEFKRIAKRLTKTEIKECFNVYDTFMESPQGKSLFKRKQVFAELPLGLNKDFEYTKFNRDNYMNQDVLLRGYIDAGIVDEEKDILICIDYKTGKYKEPKYQQWGQLLYYGIGLFSKMPYDKIMLCFAYVEHNKLNTKVIYREDIEKYKKALVDNIVNIEQESIFEKNETPLCDWCKFQDICNRDV